MRNRSGHLDAACLPATPDTGPFECSTRDLRAGVPPAGSCCAGAAAVQLGWREVVVQLVGGGLITAKAAWAAVPRLQRCELPS